MEKMDEIHQNRILEQAEMIVNVQSNFNSQFENKLDIFQNYNEILKGYGTSPLFQKSMENSRDFCAGKSSIEKQLSSLKKNQEDSFLIFVIDAKFHVFSSVIKKHDENGVEKYSALLVNLGLREVQSEKQRPYEEYIFTDKNNLIKTLRFEKYQTTVEEIYKSFKNNSHESYVNLIHGKDQTIGNCYLKEIEKGIKAALIPFSTLQKTRANMGYKEKLPKTSLYPAKFQLDGKMIETEKIHLDYFDILIKKHPHLQDSLNAYKKSYAINKSIRDFISQGTPLKYSQKEIDQHIDIKTMELLLSSAKKGFSASKIMNPVDFLNMGDLIQKCSKQNIEAFNAFDLIPKNIIEKYPRYFENAKKEISFILSKEASKSHAKANQEKNPNHLKQAVNYAIQSYGMYRYNKVAIHVIAVGYEHQKDKINAIKYHEKNLGLITEPTEHEKLKSFINTLCREVGQHELSQNRVPSAVNYLKKIDPGLGEDLINSILEKVPLSQRREMKTRLQPYISIDALNHDSKAKKVESYSPKKNQIEKPFHKTIPNHPSKGLEI
jgi:hypothetical protein